MKALVIAAVVLVLVGVGVLVASGVGAQEDGGEPKPGEKFLAKTAENLGISVDELTSAMSDAQLELIDEAVAEGKLTQEQASRLKERVEEYGPLSLIGLRHRDGDGVRCAGARLVAGSAADVLGVEPREVVEAFRDGESLAEQAEAQGMSVDDFKAALLEAIRAKLDEKVSDGTITQQQADRVFERIQSNIDEIVNAEGPLGGRPCRPWRERGDAEAETTS